MKPRTVLISLNAVLIAIMLCLSANAETKEVNEDKERYCSYISEYSETVMYLRQRHNIDREDMKHNIHIYGKH